VLYVALLYLDHHTRLDFINRALSLCHELVLQNALIRRVSFIHTFNTKFSLLPTISLLLAPLALASPTPTEQRNVERAQIAKRATISDAADTGYTTQNGG
jgi:hypothetical protein